MANTESNKILETEFSPEFIEGMKNRMLVSYYKYGALKEAYPHKVNAIESLQDRLRKYQETGNTEFLIDASNFCMIEFMHPSHPHAYFAGTDDDASPGRRSATTGRASKQDNETIGTNPNSQTARFR